MSKRSRWPVVDRLCLMAGCMPRTPFRDVVSAAAAAGFDSVTCWPNMWRHALRKDGLTLADMRALLDDHGLVLTDVDACSDWAGARAKPSGLPAPAPRAEFLDVCAAVGGTTVVAAHPVGAPPVTDEDIDGFARLCDEAAERGLRVALEFVPFTGVPDLPTALRVLERAARTNAGLVVDTGHLARSGGKPDDLRTLPPALVFSVQLVDGVAAAPADLLDEAMFHRGLPGTGGLPVVDDLRALTGIGACASVGPEIFRPAMTERPATEIAAELYEACVAVLDQV